MQSNAQHQGSQRNVNEDLFYVDYPGLKAFLFFFFFFVQTYTSWKYNMQSNETV